MSLVAMSCAAALGLGQPCSPPAQAPALLLLALAFPAVPDAELANIHGLGVEAVNGVGPVAVEQKEPAARTRTVAVAFDVERFSDRTRDIVDNWNVQVAASLIADSTNRAAL